MPWPVIRGANLRARWKHNVICENDFNDLRWRTNKVIGPLIRPGAARTPTPADNTRRTRIESAEQRFALKVGDEQLVQTNAQQQRLLWRVSFKMIATGVNRTICRARPEEDVLIHMADEPGEVPTGFESDRAFMQRILISKED
jgi:hypothetical protein